MVLCESGEENPASHRYLIEKGKNILKLFFYVGLDILWHYTKTKQEVVS